MKKNIKFGQMPKKSRLIQYNLFQELEENKKKIPVFCFLSVISGKKHPKCNYTLKESKKIVEEATGAKNPEKYLIDNFPKVLDNFNEVETAIEKEQLKYFKM